MHFKTQTNHTTGMFDVITRIVREEGPLALFKGIVPRVTWISVGGAIFFGTYENMKRILKANNNNTNNNH